MNWALWGPILGTNAVAVLGLIGVVIGAVKSHHSALAQITVLKEQADAATIQANAALEAARASTRTAEATAAAAIQDAITRATEANDKHWAIYLDAGQRRIEEAEKDIARNAIRIEAADLRSIADRAARDESDKTLRLAMAYLRTLLRWIKEVLPGERYPAPPPELLTGLSEEW